MILFNSIIGRRKNNVSETYPFAKINTKISIVNFDDAQYEKLLKNLNKDWTMDETKYLWEM